MTALERQLVLPDDTAAVARIAQLRTARVGELRRETVGRSGGVPSGLGKRPRSGPVALGELGFAGDEQADLTTHGGPAKAVLVYPAEHYRLWREELGFDLSERGLGENLRVEGMGLGGGAAGAGDAGAAWDERAVRPGDIYRIGTALVRVTAPRRPCYKLGLAHGVTQMPVLVQRTGRTGFYLAVEEPGRVEAGDTVELVKRAPHPITVFEVNRVMNLDKRDADGIASLLAAREYLPQRWVRKLEQRLAALQAAAMQASAPADDEDADRLYGHS